MPISPYVRRLRRSVGQALLLVPAVCVLPRDERGRVLVVRHADSGQWATIGGSVEVDEAPAEAAEREAREEASVDIQLTQLVAALGGPQFQVEYPNGDITAYVVIVYEALVVGGSPAPDDDETIDVAWVREKEIGLLDLSAFAQSTFAALGMLGPVRGG